MAIQFLLLGLLGGGMIGASGLFSLCGALFDWDFFMNHYKARVFVHLFGRPGARAFYAVMGIVAMSVGLMIAGCGGLLTVSEMQQH